MLTFTDIWNDAYNTYMEDGFRALCKCLADHVDAGDITEADACYMQRDVIETANL